MILVTGANGYIGQHVVKHFCDQGQKVRALVRSAVNPEEEKLLQDFGAEVVKGDLLNKEVRQQAIAGVEQVVHLLGSINKPVGEDFMTMHESRTRALVESLKPNPPKKILFVSAIGASFRSESQYQLSKWEAEEVIKKSGLPYVILRSSLVFGKEVGTRDSKMVRRMVDNVKQNGFIPKISRTEGKLQPLYIGDLVNLVDEALKHPDLWHNTLEVGGPDQVTPVQVMETINEVLGLGKKTKVVPFFLVHAIVSLMEKFAKRPKMTLEQLNLMRIDNIVRFSSAKEYFSIEYTPLKQGLEYLKSEV